MANDAFSMDGAGFEWVRAQNDLAIGFDENPYYVHVTAHMDCGIPSWHNPHPLTRLCAAEGVKLAALDTIQLRAQYHLPQRQGWRLGYDMLRNVVDHLDPHWCAAVTP